VAAEFEYLVGGGVTLETLSQVVAKADGAIIGSAISRTGSSETFIDVRAAESFGAAVGHRII
jgi:predicted TIM-barrel enzyme